jgi:hypothetical protein
MFLIGHPNKKSPTAFAAGPLRIDVTRQGKYQTLTVAADSV